MRFTSRKSASQRYIARKEKQQRAPRQHPGGKRHGALIARWEKQPCQRGFTEIHDVQRIISDIIVHVNFLDKHFVPIRRHQFQQQLEPVPLDCDHAYRSRPEQLFADTDGRAKYSPKKKLGDHKYRHHCKRRPLGGRHAGYKQAESRRRC